jgi:chromate transport protein ChrA
VNLIAFTILIGQRIAGIRGSFLAIFGLLLPSVGLTILITAGYASIRTEPLVQHALQGIIPATIGVGLYTGFDMARGAFRKAKGEGLYAVIGSLTALVAAPLLVWRHVPVPLALLGVAAFMGAFVGVWSARGRAEAA